MKKFILCLAIGTYLFAYDYSVKSYDEEYNTSEDYKYQGSSGAKYKYDLSNDIDRMKYDMDESAKIKDSINADPRIEMDRDMGQYGGGYGK